MAIQRKATAATAKPATAKPATASKAPAAVKGTSDGEMVSGASMHEATMTVTTTVLENGTIKGEPVEATQREIKLFATKPATASIGLKVKRNLGNFEAVEFSAFVSMPCYVEEIDSASAQAMDKAKALLDELASGFDPSAYVSGATAAGEDAVIGDEGEAEGEEGEGEAEGGEITEEYIRAADRDLLVALITENELDIDPDDYPDDDDLKEILIGTIFSEEGEGEGEGEAEGDEPYTAEQLGEATMEELSELWTAWEMGKFPAHNAKTEPTVKKNVIKKILAKQDEIAAA